MSRAASTLRVVSYNVLAQTLAKSSFFPASEPAALKKAARLGKALEAALRDDADVALLSEVDEWPEFWEPELARRGYAGLYLRRAKKQYGNAVVYKTSRLALAAAAGWDSNDLADVVAAGGETPPAWTAPALVLSGGAALDPATGIVNVVANNNGAGGEGGAPPPPPPPATVEAIAAEYRRDAIAVMGAFTLIEEGPSARPIVIASTHLFWDPRFAHVKGAQMAGVKAALASFAAGVCGTSCSPVDVPIILGGDLNSTPGSEVYRACVTLGLWVDGPAVSVPVSAWDALTCLPSSERATTPARAAWLAALSAAVAADAAGGGASGAVGLVSAYAAAAADAAAGGGGAAPAWANTRRARTPGSGWGEPRFTTFTPGFTDTIDYLFVSAPPEGDSEKGRAYSLRVASVLPLPSPEELQEGRPGKCLPSLTHPSDHLPLGATLELTWL